MDRQLIDELRREELSILEDLRTLAPYRRLEALRRVLSLYDDGPEIPVGAAFDALLAATHRQASTASVIALSGPRADVA